MPGALCVCMILKNERPLLPNALDALVPIASEIGQYVFVDTGSSDEGVAYLRSRLPEAEIVFHVWCDDFAEARNKALAQAKTPWVLFLDADERLAPESAPVLRRLLKQNISAEGIICRRENLDAEGAVVSWDELTRLLKVLPALRFTGSVHERPVFFEATTPSSAPPKARPLWVQREPELRLLHLAATPQLKQEKTRYYLKLIQKEREQWPSPLMHYHWATTPEVQNTIPATERWLILQHALEETLAFERSSHQLPYPQWAGVPVAGCILECQFLLIERDQRAEMLTFFEHYKAEAMLAESWGQAALAYDLEGQWRLAQQHFYTALNPQYPMADPSEGWGSWRSHAFLAALYARAEDWPAAWAHSVQAIKGKPHSRFVKAMQILQQRLTAEIPLAETRKVLKRAFKQAYEAEDSSAMLSLGCFLISLQASAEENVFLRQWNVPSALSQSPFYAWFNTLTN